MPVTMCRLNLVKGLGPVLQIAEGHTIDLPANVHDALDQRTNPTWPTTWFAPNITGHGAFRDVYSVMNNWGANHGSISYGHIGSDLITLASMLRIPVYMHNVANEKVFRPSAWAAFGTQCLESADYRRLRKFRRVSTLKALRALRKLFWRTAILVLLTAAMIVVVACFHPQTFLCIDSGEVRGDVLVVLGGGVHDRPARAADLYSRQDAPAIILTGAGDELINWRILHDAGVPGKAIQIENKSLTTQENALNTIKLLRARHFHRIILVTSWYHSRRALKTFEHYAPDLTFYSRPSYFALARIDWNKFWTGHRAHLEFMKLAGYWIRYGVNPF